MKAAIRILPVLLALAGAGYLLHAAEEASPPAADETGNLPTHLKFSDPSKAGTVRLKLIWGHVTVTATDAPDVTVVSNVKSRQQTQKNPDGLRRLDSEVTYSAAEKDNVITLDFGGDLTGSSVPGATVNVTVPRTTSVIISSAFGGDIDIKGISGDVEVHDMNGAITLDHISGAALVETMNGRIRATFTKVPADKPLSFTSMNGAVDLWVPADTKANVRLRTHNGAIYTDFDEKALVTKTEAVKDKMKHISIKTHSSGQSGEDDWQNDIHDAVREATRTGMEAARQALIAAREAAQAAREGVAEATGKPMPPIPPMPSVFGSPSGGKVVTGALNGGGPEIQVATMNGTIKLLKTQP